MEAIDWPKRFTSHISNKRLISKTYKKTQTQLKKSNYKMSKRYKQTFHGGRYTDIYFH